MSRINVFLGDDLYNDLQAVKSNLNISKICQQALRSAIDNPEKYATDAETDVMESRYTPILRIPSYLLQGLGDQGLTHIEVSGEVVEDDDLRITVGLISGQHILIPSTARLVLDESGDLVVEILKC